MTKLKLIVATVILCLSLVVILLNWQPVTLRLIVGQVTMPLALFCMVLLGLGFAGGALSALASGSKRRPGSA